MAELVTLLEQHMDRQPPTVVTQATTWWEAVLALVKLQAVGLEVHLPVKVCCYCVSMCILSSPHVIHSGFHSLHEAHHITTGSQYAVCVHIMKSHKSVHVCQMFLAFLSYLRGPIQVDITAGSIRCKGSGFLYHVPL